MGPVLAKTSVPALSRGRQLVNVFPPRVRQLKRKTHMYIALRS